jgi:hypothetical protein
MYYKKNKLMIDKKASNLYHDFTMLKDIDRKIKIHHLQKRI